MHVLIACTGSAGDVYPFIAIGQVLDRRGHEVVIVAPGQFRQTALDAGLRFLSVGSASQLKEVAQDKDLWGGTTAEQSVRALWRHMGRLHEQTYSLLERCIRPGESVIIGSTFAFPARLLQEKLGVPMATVHLWPPAMMSAIDPTFNPAMPWLGKLPAWLVRIVHALEERRALDPAILPDLNAFRAKLGLPRIRSAWRRWMHSPERVICAFPDWFCAPRKDWPANTVCTAFPRLNAPVGATMPHDLAAFLDAGPPPIAFTPGSAMGVGRTFFERAVAASQILGQRAVLITRFADQLPASLPSNVHHCLAVPYDLLAPRVAAFVHHGGIGTSAQVLAAGRPHLITPFGHDQHDNAARLVKLGVAASVLPDSGVDRWVSALAQLIGSAAVQKACATYASKMAREQPAADQIADWVEQVHDHHGDASRAAWTPSRTRQPALA